MEHEVKGCKDCPFMDDIEVEDSEGDLSISYYCNHPKRYLVNLWQDDDGVVTPGDCPLHKESITIKLTPP